MSEQRDILERLRSYHYAVFNSDDAEEAADEIERLRHDIERHIKIAADLATENETIRYQLEKTVAALKPFAEQADLYDVPDNRGEPWLDHEKARLEFVRVGDLRDARAALTIGIRG